MKTAVIVGGGIAGIYSAILLKRKYEKVYIVEQEKKLGGLLRSFQNEHGDWFDYGTHFIAGTNVDEIDNVIINKDWIKDWYRYKNEKGGNFFNNVLSESCLFVNAKDIGDDYYKGLSEFLEIISYGGSYNHAEEQLEKTFGHTFAHKIYIPALCKLFCVDTLQEIATDAHLRFGMKRLRILNQEATESIKTISTYDDRVSHHQFHIGDASRHQYYPKEGGAGKWVEKFEDLLASLNIEIICGESVVDIEHRNNVVTEVGLSNGVRIPCDTLVWTVPLVFMFRAAKIPCETSRPKLINTTLFHYVFDKEPVCEDHFFFCYDPNYSPFRVTLYSNLQPELAKKSRRHRVTVEVLSNKPLELEKMSIQVFEELKIMKIIHQKANVLYQEPMVIPQGFPVLSHEFIEASTYQYKLAKDSFKNLYLQGKNNTKDWFMNEVFKSIHKDFGS